MNEELLYTLKLVLSAILFKEYLGVKIKIESTTFYYSTVLIQIYFSQLSYCFYENDDELKMISILNNVYIEIQCSMQFVTLNILTYVSGTIGSTTFSQSNILTE